MSETGNTRKWKCKYVHFITFPDEFEILKKSGIQPQMARTLVQFRFT